MEGAHSGDYDGRSRAGSDAVGREDKGHGGECDGGATVEGGWSRPRVGLVKLNVDAGVVDGIRTGLGIVCRNASGSIEWCVSIQSVAGMTPEVAEALAVLEGFKEARSSGHAKVEVESDCCGVIADLKARKRGRSELALIYDDIFSLYNCFDIVSFSFVSRNINTVAHGLAHVVSWTVGRRSWVCDLPNWILCKANEDLMNMN
ncbi:uncharacterized protein LOC141614684 [Silene latifolia]|uniref:uncharacterized protein LOC141614684 n=1 Tax=Silene latifolia TaxID=37657 RepID=UPI003D77FE6F